MCLCASTVFPSIDLLFFPHSASKRVAPTSQPHSRVSLPWPGTKSLAAALILKESGPGLIVIFFPSPPPGFPVVLSRPHHSLYRPHATMTTLSTSRGRSALAVSTVFTSLATALVLVRIYTRVVLVKQMGSDDYTILVALVGGFAG